jgi:putative aldouronate transport system permease protein
MPLTIKSMTNGSDLKGGRPHPLHTPVHEVAAPRAHSGVAGARLRHVLEPFLFVLPGLAVLVIFSYVPMVALQIAFRDYLAPLGFFGSPWVGFKHFTIFLGSPVFGQVLINTLSLRILGLLFGFPWAVIFALGLNEVDNTGVKRLYQTISWAPHFVSVVVVVGMVFLFTSPSSGLINHALRFFGRESVHFMVEPGWFLPLYILSGIWQGLGFGTVIYLATLSTVSPELHEAAIVDGATRFQRVVRINLPALIPIIVIQLILQSGQMLRVGFEKVFLMQTALNRSASEVLSTYVYRQGLLGGRFSYATAVGLFTSVIGMLMILAVNRIARRFGETALW